VRFAGLDHQLVFHWVGRGTLDPGWGGVCVCVCVRPQLKEHHGGSDQKKKTGHFIFGA